MKISKIFENEKVHNVILTKIQPYERLYTHTELILITNRFLISLLVKLYL